MKCALSQNKDRIQTESRDAGESNEQHVTKSTMKSLQIKAIYENSPFQF